MSKMIIRVNYIIEFDSKEEERLLKLAKELGCTYLDAGPILSIRRLLKDVGIDGAFPNEHSVGLGWELEDDK